jgi:hypothetical protein
VAIKIREFKTLVAATKRKSPNQVGASHALIIFDILSVTPVFAPVVRYISSLVVLFFVASAIYIIFVLWTGNMTVGHCLVLLCRIISAMFHNKLFSISFEKSYHSTDLAGIELT